MHVRLVSPASLWIALAVLAAADVLIMAAAGFQLGWHGLAMIIAGSAGALALGSLYSYVRPDARLAALAYAAAYLILFTFVAAVFSYVGTSLGRPLLDAHFAKADALLGFDWTGALAFADAHPVVGTTLRLAYASSLPQVALVLVVLAATRQFQRLGDFLALFSITGLTTIGLSILFPAAGAFVFHDPPQELRDVVGPASGIWHLEHFQALRSGAMRTIDPRAIEGLVTFPSFHTALAVITTWAFWRTRVFALPALALNAVVVASTLPVGGHYLVDVMAGASIAGGCVALLAGRRWQGWTILTVPRSASGAAVTQTASSA
jgi:membrane-associated phospholipid phosphatase